MNKTARIHFRSSVFEKKLIKARAKRSGLNMSEYCRRAALGREIKERFTPEQLEVADGIKAHLQNFGK